MKKNIITLISIAVAILTSCKRELDINVTGITLNTERVLMLPGDQDTLTATLSPANATNPNVIWSSSDKSIVDVRDGIIRANSVGSAKITAKSDDGGLTVCCEIVVNEVIVHVDGIGLTDRNGKAPEKIELIKGQTDTLSVNVSPQNATDGSIQWSSSDSTVFTVTDDGIIKATGSGKATLTAYAYDGGFSSSCIICVTNPASRIVLDSTSITMNQYEIRKLSASIEPEDSDARLIWSSGNEELIAVNQLGEIHVLKNNSDANSAKITVTSSSDPEIKAECTVTVIYRVIGVDIEAADLYLAKDSSALAKVTIYPSRATVKDVEWSSSDNSIASVSKDGAITAVKNGTATITVKTADGGKTDSCVVHVFTRVSGMTFSEKEFDLPCGASKKIDAAITPADATWSGIRWTSSDNSVVTVDSNGMVTAKSTGKAVITASSVDGAYMSSCTVNVTSALKGISLHLSENGRDSLYVTETCVLNAVLEPADATDVSLIWESDKPDVANVVNGAVIAMKPGIASISVSSGTFRDSKTITVMAKVEGIRIDRSELDLIKGKTAKLTGTILPEQFVAEKDTKIEWATDNPSVATVDNNGTVTAKSSGTAVITVKSLSGNFTASCKVTVTNPLTKFSISPATDSLIVGESVRLKITDRQPSDADVIGFKWKSSNPEIATVDGTGNVTALADGVVTITATTEDGRLKAESILIIEFIPVPVSMISAGIYQLTMNEGETKQLSLKFTPENATNKKVVWSSSQPRVASVTQDGLIKALENGTSTITATAADGNGAKYSITVTVNSVTAKIHVESVDVLDPFDTIYVGETKTIHAAIKPANATDMGVRWSAGTSSVDIISAKCGKATNNAVEGIIKGLKPGRARITVASTDIYDGYEMKVTLSITVLSRPVETVSLDKNGLLLKIGESYTLKANITPASATTKTITWTSSDSSVAEVSSSGIVKALKKGETTITATTKDGNKTAACKVKVTDNGSGGGSIVPAGFVDL